MAHPIPGSRPPGARAASCGYRFGFPSRGTPHSGSIFLGPNATPFAGICRTLFCWLVLLVGTLSVVSLAPASAAGADALEFQRDIRPLIGKYCSDCHADGASKGGVDFDQMGETNGIPGNPRLWLEVLSNVRAGLMPPARKERPSAEEQKRLEAWIKYVAFGIDPANPDPGRTTVRRLNRVQYRNTIRDLLGVEFKAEEEFPPDDTGHGFDTMADVLTVSPLLLEKYVVAARSIVGEAVPRVPRIPAERVIAGARFNSATGEGPLSLPYIESVSVTNFVTVQTAGTYQLVLDLTTTEKFVDDVFDYNRCRLVVRADGRELVRREFAREGERGFRLEASCVWDPGEHPLVLEMEPLTPGAKPVRSLALRVNRVVVRGPMDPAQWVRPSRYEQFFPGVIPDDPVGRRAKAAQILGDFAARAFRRPVDDRTRERLAVLAEGVYSQPGKEFEAGVAEAMVAVLASPRFVFLEEGEEPPAAGSPYPRLDEYALACRLSYFLWSSMPDSELTALAASHRLRENLEAQVRRLLADSRSAALVGNFAGQWLQARDIETVVVDSRAVLGREDPPNPERDRKLARFRVLRNRDAPPLSAEEKEEIERLRKELFRPGQARAELGFDLRRAMRRETEMTFDYILRGDRPVTEFLESDYTFLNEKLAKHYGLTQLDVVGDDLRKVTLPADSVRGGVLTQGTILVATSNPTRTSPVKRGVFLLENVLGTPPPPPPPDVPSLEDAAQAIQGRTPTLRETLELHRKQAVCSSCHNRMDPPGLGFENFNALGMWRDQEFGNPVEAGGQLITGESFSSVRELKHLLATQRRGDFYRCLTEKLLTYALGRGLEYSDVETVDRLVQRLEAAGGRPSALILGIVESAPFQQRRREIPMRESRKSAPTSPERVSIRTSP